MVAVFPAADPVEEAAEAGKIHAFASENLLHKGGMRMDLWVAGIALLIIATGILVLILCREKIHKGLRIAVVCVLGVLFAAVLGYIALTFLFLNSLDSPTLDKSTASGKVLSEKQATVEEHKTPVPVPSDCDLPVSEVPEFLPDVLSVRNLQYEQTPVFSTINETAAYAL